MNEPLTVEHLIFAAPFPLAVGIAWLLELAYRRAVVRGMRLSAAVAAAPTMPALPIDALRGSARGGDAPTGDIASRISRGRTRVLGVHVAAGLTHAATSAVALFIGEPGSFSLPGYAIAVGMLSWPLVPTLWTIGRGSSAQLRSGLFVIGLMSATPLAVFVFTATGAIGESDHSVVQLVLQAIVAIILAMLVLAGCLGVLWWMARVHQKGNASGEVLVVRWFWLASSLLNLLIGLVVYGCGGVIALVPYALYRLQLALTLRRAPEGSPTSLLVLRVFTQRRRRERLMRVLARDWTFVGPVRLIAGPDLAAATLDASELFEFLTGRLRHRFLTSAASLAEALGPLEAHSDGRYPVKELFCQEDAWRPVLQELVRSSDVVLMDLRGFSAANRGAAYEIAQIVDLFPLSRVVFAVDDTTDRGAMEASFDEAWRSVGTESPNAGRRVEPHVYESTDDPRGLVAELAAVSAPPAMSVAA